MKYDVVIIGGGMSGLMSSIYLAEQGLKTAVVSKGDPVCSISSGCIDLAGDFSIIPENHPYQKVGREKIQWSLEYFKSLMEKEGLAYEGETFQNRSIYTPIARKRITSMVPRSMEEAENAQNHSLHIISFKGMKDFFPGYFKSESGEENYSLFDADSKTTIGIATRFDDDLFREDFFKWLSKLDIKEDYIGIPAVLGTKNPEDTIERIEKVTGKKVFEIPTIPPSMPGFRLFRTLKRAASQRGVDIFWGNAISEFSEVKDQIQSLKIDQPGRPINIEGKSFILATGSFVSGGLFAEKDSVRETVFNLPVSIPEGEQRLNDSFFDPGHPLGKAGIAVDDQYKPLNSPLNNLFIGGSILENSQIMKYQCGHGLAIVTGLEAAKKCEEYLK